MAGSNSTQDCNVVYEHLVEVRCLYESGYMLRGTAVRFVL